MKIREKTVLVFDVEIFRNIFHCAVKNTETGIISLFEISNRKNQLYELVKFFKQFNNTEGSWNESYTTDYKFKTDVIFAGYNNIHFDNAIINYIIDYYDNLSWLPYEDICNSLYCMSQVIITSKDGQEDKWKKWKYQQWYESFDILTMLYSTQLRVGLKEMQVTMQYPNVQEFVCDWNKPLPEDKFDEMIEYNINDVNSTSELLDKCKKEIELRIAIEDEYGVRVLSKDGVNIGMKIITQKYLEATGQTWWQIKDLRSPMDKIPLSNVILPFVEYKHPTLKKMLSELRKQVVSPGRKGYEYKFIFNNLRYTVGVGGLHSVNDPEIIIPKEDEMLIDIDVASLYPSMLIQYEFYPKHLGREFLDVYSNIRTERLEAKHNGNKIKNETLKLALNGLSGNLQNEHNFCYSPFAVMQIRINGQLLLLMLAEALSELGCRIVQANTDGLFVLLKKDKYEQVNAACRAWEKLTKLELEEDRFEAMYQYAINDYIAVGEGYKDKIERFKFDPEIALNKKGESYKSVKQIHDDYIKTKGMFITEVFLGKGLSAKIIPEAIINYFVDDIPVEQTIKECKDIRKFLKAEKTGKQWTVEYNEQVQQRINRFYVSNSGYYLWKWKETGDKEGEIKEVDYGYGIIERYTAHAREYQNMLKGYGVRLHNTLYSDEDLNWKYSQGETFQSIYDVNYHYYIRQATKIIEELKPRQLSLFNF